jgi:hypothetical protein
VALAELEAAAALYQGAALERLGVLTIADRIAELWLQGGMPVGATSDASRTLDRYWLRRAERPPDGERRAIYETVFDARFDELWGELVATLAASGGGAGDASARAEGVREHLSARIDEPLLGVTALLHAQLGAALAVLETPEILEAHGARDLWQLVEQRGRLDLGAAPDVVRVRTMAASGAAVIGWLAEDEGSVPEEVADAARSWLAAAAPRADA